MVVSIWGCDDIGFKIEGCEVDFEMWDWDIFKEMLRRKSWLIKRFEFFKCMFLMFIVLEEIGECKKDLVS